MERLVLGEELDLHARHVHAGRALALAPLARDAQVERFAHRLVARFRSAELVGERQAQRVGAPAREIALRSRRAIARAHGPGVELAAMAVVVAHLHRAGQAAPGAPVEGGGGRCGAIVRPVAEERTVVLARRIHDLAGVHVAARIEPRLDLGQRRGEARPEERRDPLRAHQAVAAAVLARVGALASGAPARQPPRRSRACVSHRRPSC